MKKVFSKQLRPGVSENFSSLRAGNPPVDASRGEDFSERIIDLMNARDFFLSIARNLNTSLINSREGTRIDAREGNECIYV